MFHILSQTRADRCERLPFAFVIFAPLLLITRITLLTHSKMHIMILSAMRRQQSSCPRLSHVAVLNIHFIPPFRGASEMAKRNWVWQRFCGHFQVNNCQTSVCGSKLTTRFLLLHLCASQWQVKWGTTCASMMCHNMLTVNDGIWEENRRHGKQTMLPLPSKPSSYLNYMDERGENEEWTHTHSQLPTFAHSHTIPGIIKRTWMKQEAGGGREEGIAAFGFAMLSVD